MEIATIELRNTFHGTSCRVRVPAATWVVSAAQVARIRRALCGVDDCACAMDDAGCRPRQVEVRPDGSGFVIPWAAAQTDGTNPKKEE